MQTERYSTTRRRAAAAVAAGAAVGAVATNAPMLVVGLLYFDEPGGFESQHIPFLFYMVFIAFVVWIVGLALVGVPMWWLLHKKRLRSWWVAVLCGAIAAFVGGFAASLALTLPIEHASFGDSGGHTMIDGEMTAYGWQSLVLGAVQIGVCGAIVAAVIWRVAYRRVETCLVSARHRPSASPWSSRGCGGCRCRHRPRSRRSCRPGRRRATTAGWRIRTRR